MRRVRRDRVGMLLGVMVGCAIAACGSTTKLPEAPPTGALTASQVSVTTTGNADATVDPHSVTFQIDTSGSLVAHCTVTSAAAAAETVSIRGSLIDAGGNVIGDVTGGDVNVPPGGSVDVELNGPAPNGTIAQVTFEVSTQAAPTPTSAPA